MQFYIQHDGQRLGPYSLEEVRSQIANRTLQPTDLAWHEGAAHWQPLSAIPDMAGSFPPPVAVQSSGLATASMVLGILSFLLCGLTSLPAVICGHISLSRIKKSSGALLGEGKAIAGLVMGYMAIAFLFMVLLLSGFAAPSLMRARKRTQAGACKQDLRMIDAAVNQWAIEKDKQSGATPQWSDLKPYMRDNSRLGTSATCTDILGNPITIPPVGKALEVPPATWRALSDVTGADFWSPYQTP